MDIGVKPASRERASYFIKLALQALRESGGSLRFREIKDYIRKHAQFMPSDLEVYEKTGYIRWESILSFYSIDCVKAGYIIKRSGTWHLTPEGEAVLGLPAKEILEKAGEAYADWAAARSSTMSTTKETASGAPQIAEEEEAEKVFVWERAESEARAEIEEYVRSLGPYEFQDLVAALLRAMEYYTPFIAPTGPDGGTDVLAYPDPIGAQTPHVRVQVKHRISQKAARDEIAALRGIIRQGREIGLFVSTAGFTNDAIREARGGSVHIELMDLAQLLDSWIDHYEKLSEEDKSHLRLRPIYFLAP